MQWTKDHKKFEKVMIMPLQIILNALGLAPLIIEFYISFTDWSPRFTSEFWRAALIGPANYIKFFQDMFFWQALGRTALYVGVALAIEFIIGFVVAYFMVEDFIGKKTLLAIYLLPLIIAPIVAGYIWYLFLLTEGPMNSILSMLLGQRVTIAWLSDPIFAQISIIIALVWEWSPFILLVMLAGLMSVPPDPVNAARVLGASEFTILRKIIFPYIKPLMIIAGLIAAFQMYKIYDIIYIMTGGGPGYTTQAISIYLYEQAFRFMRMAYAGAESIFLWITLLITTYIFVRRAKVI